MWLSLLLVFVHTIRAQQDVPQNCTLSQALWLQFFDSTLLEDPVPPVTLCGVPLPTLMRVNTARLLQSINAPWLAASHTYCTAVLNAWAVSQACNLTAVNTALLLLGDSLTQSCENRSAWVMEPLLEQAHSLLMHFNEGQWDTCVQCTDDDTNRTNSNTTPVEPFYYYQEPDIVTLRLLDSNATLTYSLLKGRWNTTLGLSLMCLLLTLYAIVATVCVLLLYNPNKRFVCCLRSEETVYASLAPEKAINDDEEDVSLNVLSDLHK